MNDQPVAPQPAPAQPPPPPPPPTRADDGDSGGASGVLRAFAVLGALIVAFGAAIVIAVMVDLGSSPICDDVGGALFATEDCYDVSSTAKPFSLVLGWAGGVVGIMAALALFRFTIRGSGGRLALQLLGAAVVLAGLSIAIA
jgi:hypothetical protein